LNAQETTTAALFCAMLASLMKARKVPDVGVIGAAHRLTEVAA